MPIVQFRLSLERRIFLFLFKTSLIALREKTVHPDYFFLRSEQTTQAAFLSAFNTIKKNHPFGWIFLWCRLSDSNRRPDDYKSTALPTELNRRCRIIIHERFLKCKLFFKKNIKILYLIVNIKKILLIFIIIFICLLYNI